MIGQWLTDGQDFIKVLDVENQKAKLLVLSSDFFNQPSAMVLEQVTDEEVSNFFNDVVRKDLTETEKNSLSALVRKLNEMANYAIGGFYE